MKLKWIKINNYRSCKDIQIDIGSMQAIVGANNAGKSSIIRALDFFFNPSVTKIDEESFWNRDTDLQIWIEGIFIDLSDIEKEKLSSYLCPDASFHIARSATMKIDSESASGSDYKIEISQHYCKPMPNVEWLQDSNINGNKINEWWQIKDTLVINSQSFIDFVGNTKPGVGVWKEKAKEFSDFYLNEEDFENSWSDNPAGYANVLKGNLPHFIFVPAVKDVTEEAKVTKTNPFGKLLYSIINSVTEGQRESLDKHLLSVQNQLNRTGGDNRIKSICETEKRLNDFLNEYMPVDLEIEFQPPTIEMLLTTPKLFADDGFRNIVENKGHGLQRAIIFSILRCYSELVTGRDQNKTRNTIFAVEEPELYMHPQAQRTIRRVFKKISSLSDQVFFTTHSDLLLDVTYFDEIIRVEAQKYEDEGNNTIISKIWQLPIDKLVNDIKIRHPDIKNISPDSTRELYFNACHPDRAEGFFAKKIILVEGPTEQYSIPIYAAALSIQLDSLNVSVINCNGKGPMDRLYRIFNELGIPCYLIFDYDKDNSDPQCIRKSKELLELLNINVELKGEIFYSSKASYFPNKWEIDLKSEIPQYDEIRNDAKIHLGLNDDSGKPLISRYMANQLVSQDPPFIPKPLEKMINLAINIEWSESCLKKESI